MGLEWAGKNTWSVFKCSLWLTKKKLHVLINRNIFPKLKTKFPIVIIIKITRKMIV